MAVFKTPRITTAQREALILEPSEIVFDIDKCTFYGGDGEKLGGFLIGSYGQYIDYIVQQLTLTQEDIENKRLTLPSTPINPDAVTLTIKGGISQINREDYQIEEDVLIWENLGLDGFLEEGDVLILEYSMNQPAGFSTQTVIITEQNLLEKQLVLIQTPINPTAVTVDFKGGIPQVYGEDFTIMGNILNWRNLGLDGFLEIGDVLIIQF